MFHFKAYVARLGVYYSHWAAEPEVRLARGVDLRSVPSAYASLSTCSCVSMRAFLKFTHTMDLIEHIGGEA